MNFSININMKYFLLLYTCKANYSISRDTGWLDEQAIKAFKDHGGVYDILIGWVSIQYH